MRVFISHSHKDKKFVAKLALDLERHGVDVWYSEWEMQPGDSLTARIADGIESAGVMIVVVSKSSVKSRWVEKEISLGMVRQLKAKGVSIIPVLLQNCEFPAASSFRALGETMYSDFRGDYEFALARLVASLGARPPRTGIKACREAVSELRGARQLSNEKEFRDWKYDRLSDAVSLHVEPTEEYAARNPSVLIIPLTKSESSKVRTAQEILGWRYWDLRKKQGRYRAVVQITFAKRDGAPSSLAWYIDRDRQVTLQVACDVFSGDECFGVVGE